MKKLIFSLLIVASIQMVAQSKVSKEAVAEIVGTSSSIPIAGQAEFYEGKKKNGKVSLHVRIKGLQPLSKHAIHIHERGNCGENGKAAGGHWNPMNHPHGHLIMTKQEKEHSPSSAHKGDLGNLMANEQGNAKLAILTSEWCVGCGDTLRDVVGKSIIIHESEDDFKTQPTGGAGGRIGCGVIAIRMVEKK